MVCNDQPTSDTDSLQPKTFSYCAHVPPFLTMVNSLSLVYQLLQRVCIRRNIQLGDYILNVLLFRVIKRLLYLFHDFFHIPDNIYKTSVHSFPLLRWILTSYCDRPPTTGANQKSATRLHAAQSQVQSDQITKLPSSKCEALTGQFFKPSLFQPCGRTFFLHEITN